MDVAKTRKHLAEADENVKKGEARVAEQEARIRQLSLMGKSTDLADEILASLKQSLKVMIENRQIIVEELRAATSSPQSLRRE